MAIPVPQFQIPALSPAALLGNDNDNGGFASAIERAMTNYAQMELQRRSQEHALKLEDIRQTAGRENLFTQLLADNEIVPLTDAPIFPGDSIPEYTALQGPTGSKYEGQEFVSSAQIDQARRQHFLDQPFTLPGVEVAPGTKRSDVLNYSPSGGVQLISGEILDHVIGQPGGREALLETADAMATNYSAIPGMKQLASRMREIAEHDPFLSNAELRNFADQGFAAARFPNYEASIRAINLADQQNRALIHSTSLDIQQRWQLANDDETGQIGSRRNLTPDEFTTIALMTTGNEALVTDEMKKRYDEMVNGGLLKPRIGPADYQEMINSVFLGGQTAGNPANTAFIQFIRGNLFDGEGGITNHALRDYLDKHGFNTGASDLARFSESPASAPFHAAHALQSIGRATRSQINQYLKYNGQGALPFGTDGAFKAFEMLYGDAFNDVPAVPSRGDVRPSELDGAGEEAATSEALSAFEPDRARFTAAMNKVPPEIRNEFRAALQSGDAEAIADSFIEAANQHHRAAISASGPEGREANKALADLYRKMATTYRNNPAMARALTDSVFVPILDSIASDGPR